MVVSVRRAACHTRAKQQRDVVGTTQVEVVADNRLEELPTVERGVEDLRQTDLQLPDRQTMLVAGSAIGSGQRPRQTL
jgi:hypothetical protein